MVKLENECLPPPISGGQRIILITYLFLYIILLYIYIYYFIGYNLCVELRLPGIDRMVYSWCGHNTHSIHSLQKCTKYTPRKSR